MPTYIPFEDTPYSRLHVRDHYWGHCSEELIKYLPFRPGLTVLDYDCRNGDILTYLLPRTGQAWGMTPDRHHAAPAWLKARMAVAHIARLPLADACLDAVILHDLQFDAPAQREAVLHEIARVLRPGGHLLWLMERPGQNHMRDWFALLPFDLQATEPLNYLTGPTMIWLGHIPGLRASMAGKTMMKLVTFVDGLLARHPALHRYSHHLIVVAERQQDGSTDR